MQEKLEEYILNHIDAEPEMMRQLNRESEHLKYAPQSPALLLQR